MHSAFFWVRIELNVFIDMSSKKNITNDYLFFSWIDGVVLVRVKSKGFSFKIRI